MILRITSLIFLLPFIFSCKKNCDDSPMIPLISFEEPIYDGNELILIARGDNEDDYRWKGPNGFTANGKSANLGIVDIGNSGVYSVIVTNEDCGTAISEKLVDVVLRDPPCEPENQNINFDDYHTIYDSVPECGYNDFLGNYTIALGSLYGSVTIVFPDSIAPDISKNYSVAGKDSILNSRQVRIEIFTGEPPDFDKFYATDGIVYTRVESGMIELVFCEVIITSDTDATQMSGRVSCQL